MKISSDGNTIPDPVFEIGTTTVNFHLLPYIKELTNSANLYVNGLDGSQAEYSIKFDDNGNASISFDQYGTVRAFLVDDNSPSTFGSYTFFPGETVDCYVDMRTTGRRAMSHRDPMYKGKVYSSLHTGKYRDFDKIQDSSNFDYGYYGFNPYTGYFADYQMTGDEYKSMVKRKYDALSDSIAKLNAPQAVKDYKMLSLQNEVLEAMANYRYFLEHNYRNVHDAWEQRELPPDSIPGRLTDEDLKEVTTWFDIDNPKLLMEDKSIGSLDWNALGVKGDLSKSINMYRKMASRAKDSSLSQEDLEELKTLSNPFFAAACDSMYQNSKRALAKINSVECFRETPKVADSEIFDAIIAEHKGKVVMVDLWNTWCGPCRGALKATEPLKDNELSDKDIVWIYIADETSDPNKYLEMIPNIRGIHYKLTRPQIEIIRDRFDVDGIPFYILVDREGNANGRPDLRDHSKYIKAIKELL
ncbi:MAG: TlpA family protein disulfide reductase [Muribaculaceae bacterium]|nr:TlpA family protein disulfide reductase [Muribaculaceae bacterium]